MARRMFCLLLGAKRPLKIFELRAALSLMEQSRGGKVDYSITSFSKGVEFADLGGGLVRVEDEGVVDFIHSTTRQYVPGYSPLGGLLPFSDSHTDLSSRA